jgi:hypothetical protein
MLLQRHNLAYLRVALEISCKPASAYRYKVEER